MENVFADPTTESAVIHEDEEFYENLEAPMFLDLTAPDLAQPDDCSWFCVKIGCDQNHEQIDPEALNKSFMLRVMAARSPNVRLHKAIKRGNGRLNAKCPHSAPAKQPRSRLHRLSSATEIPDKLAISKLKNHPISSLKSPQSQTKKMVLNAIEEKEATSTPKNQEMNSKTQPPSGGKNGSAFFSAKPLFSSSPKKETKEVCAKLQKLNLNDTKKRSVPSRYLGKVSKAAKRCDQSNPNDSNLEQETEIAPRKKNLRLLWKTKQQPLEEKVKKMGPDVTKGDQNLESDPKKECLRPIRKLTRATRKAGLEQATTTQVKNKDVREELVLKPEIKQKSGANKTNKKQKLEMGPKRKSSRPLWKSTQPVLKSNMEENTTCGTKNEEVVTDEGPKLKIRGNLGNRVEKDGLKTESENCDSITSGTGTKDANIVGKVGLKSKVRLNSRTQIQKDDAITELNNCDGDKENIVQNGSKRIEVRKNSKVEGKTTSLLRTIENVPSQQALKSQKKPSQINLDQVAKNKKTTNPRPFRLRTDERGILKEANMEKKKLVQSEPPKDESKNILRKEFGAERCKGRVVPSKYQCLTKGPTSLESKRKNAPSLCGKKQEFIANANSVRSGMKRIRCDAGNTKR